MSSPRHCPAMSGRGWRCPTSRLRRTSAPPATQRGMSASEEEEELASSSRRSMLGFWEPSSWARLEPRSLPEGRIAEGADNGAMCYCWHEHIPREDRTDGYGSKAAATDCGRNGLPNLSSASTCNAEWGKETTR